MSKGVTTAKAIVKQLEYEKISDPLIQIPTFIQINNLKNNSLLKTNPTNFNFADLFEILRLRSTIKDEEDEPFIICHQIKVDEDDESAGPPIQNRQFRFAISTKRLVRLASKHSSVIQADSTYKLIWNGNPVLIAGITDKHNHFHPYILAVCSNETQDDYHFLFHALQEGIRLIGN